MSPEFTKVFFEPMKNSISLLSPKVIRNSTTAFLNWSTRKDWIQLLGLYCSAPVIWSAMVSLIPLKIFNRCTLFQFSWQSIHPQYIIKNKCLLNLQGTFLSQWKIQSHYFLKVIRNSGKASLNWSTCKDCNQLLGIYCSTPVIWSAIVSPIPLRIFNRWVSMGFNR